MSNFAVGIQFNVNANSALNTINSLKSRLHGVSNTFNSGVNAVKGYSQSLKRVYSSVKGNKLKKLGWVITKIGRDFKKGISPINKFIAKLKGAGGQAEKTGSKIKGMGSKLKTFAAIGIGAVGITSVVSGVAKSLQEVEVAGASLRATAGIDKTSESYKKLDTLAEKLAATTQFSKTQVLGAMDAMASQGQTTKQILIGINAVTTSSAASMGKVDLVASAQNLGGALGAFQLEAGKSMKVVDMFARATQVTSLKIEDLKNVARDTSIAAGMGQDFGTMTSMVGMIKKIAGSTEQAGTMVKGFSRSINNIKANPKLQGELKKYGISMFDAKGNAKNFIDIVTQVEGSLNKMNDPMKKAAVLKKIFTDSEAMAGYNNVVKLGIDNWRQKAAEINKAKGVGKGFEKEFLDTMEGKLALMSSAWDAFSRSLFSSLGPAIKWVAVSMSALFSDTTATTPAWIVGLKDVFSSLWGVISMVGSAIKDMWAKITSGSTATSYFTTLSKVIKTIGSVLQPVIWLVTNLMAGLIKISVAIADFVVNNSAIQYFAIGIGLVTVAVYALNIAMSMNPIGLIVIGIGVLIGLAALLIANWESVKGFFVGLWDSVTNTFKKAYNWIKVKFLSVVLWILEKAAKIPLIGGKFKGMADSVRKSIKSIEIKQKALSQSNNSLKKSTITLTSTMKQYYKDAEAGSKSGIKSIKDYAKLFIQKQIQMAMQARSTQLYQALASAKGFAEKAKIMQKMKILEKQQYQNINEMAKQEKVSTRKLILNTIKDQALREKLLAIHYKKQQDVISKFGGIAFKTAMSVQSKMLSGENISMKEELKLRAKFARAVTELHKKSSISKANIMDILRTTMTKKVDQEGKTVIKMTETHNSMMRQQGGKMVSTFIKGFLSKSSVLKSSWARMLNSSIKRQMPSSDAQEGPLSNITGSGKGFITAFSSGIQTQVKQLKSTVQKAFTGIMPKKETVKVGFSGRTKQGVITSPDKVTERNRSQEKERKGVYIDFKNNHFYFQGKELSEGSSEGRELEEQITGIFKKALGQYA